LFDDIILIKNHPIFEKIKDSNNIKKYISISIEVGNKGNKGIIDYILHDTNDENDEYGKGIKVLTENYDNKNIIMSLINKILYHYPLIKIYDINYNPMIISTNDFLDNQFFNDYDKNIISRRKGYWDECYSKYNELYF